ncbi:MAG: hypothetical protein U7123_02325 [Potamolinea sp.]
MPEIWRYDERGLPIYHLQAGEYIQADISLPFPQFPVQEIPAFVVQNMAVGRRDLRQSFRARVQTLYKNGKFLKRVQKRYWRFATGASNRP